VKPKREKRSPFECPNPFSLTCIAHGRVIYVRCGRWRNCVACSAWKQWSLRQRLITGIEQIPEGKLPMFCTLTFPLADAPDEDEAHRAWRSLVARLRYRRYLSAYAWFLQRTRKGTLHYHAIVHMPWMDLAEFRDLIVASGFGPQNKLVIAEPQHAGYCAKYISSRLATLAPLRRAYGFSADFPRAKAIEAREALAEHYGVVPDRDDCDWVPSYLLRL
jgi:hypothetical protein